MSNPTEANLLYTGKVMTLGLITSPLIALLKKSSPSTRPTPQQYLTSHILRMALAEAPALAAIVGLLIFAPAMNVKETPELALLLIPYLSLLVTGLRHLPDKHKLNDFISGDIR